LKAGSAIVALGRIAGEQAIPDDLRGITQEQTSDV
jgi:hypothetical protein